MFGMRHRVFFQCLMNGANHLEEVDATPMHLCPVCLRKLHHAVRFDPVARYTKIQSFCQANEMESEATWLGRRLTAIRAAK
jgi:archaemetzincin